MRTIETQKRPISAYLDWLVGAMLLVIVGIMPLVVRFTERPMPPETVALFNGKTTYNDMLAYWKQWFLMPPSWIIILGFIGYLVISQRQRVQQARLDLNAVFSRPPVLAATVYFFFVLLSLAFSDFRYTALHGTYERNEGIFVQAAYITIFIASLYYFRGPKHAKLILYGLIFSSLLMGAVALGQLFRHDFFTTRFAAWIVLGDWDKTLNVTILNSVFGTLFNPNTYGLYTAMLAPLLLIIGFVYDGKKWVNALFLLTGALTLAGMVGSASIGGMFGTLAAALALALTYVSGLIWHKRKPSKRAVIIVAAVAAGLLLSYFLIPPIKTGVNRAGVRIAEAIKAEKNVPPNYVFNRGVLLVTNADGKVFFSVGGREGDDFITILNSEGEPVASELYHMEAGQYNFFITVSDGKVNHQFTIQYRKNSIIVDGMYFSLQNGQIVPHMANGTPIDTSKPVAAWGFKGREHWGSARGFIWSRTFPLMGKYAIIGSGSDSFINVFPQHDIVGKLRFHQVPYIIVDKAHNLYLQTWITTGGISALALLFLLAFYWITTFTALVREQSRENTFAYGLRLGLLAAVSAFSVSSLATDSTIATMGVFCVLLGMGYAANEWAAHRPPALRKGRKPKRMGSKPHHSRRKPRR